MYGRRWGKKRAAQLEQEPFCRLCAAIGIMTRATVADHIEPHRGDPVAFWNNELQSLCKLHHDSTKQIQEKSGYLTGSDLNGVPLDPGHHWNATK
jgi:5-methylcytosine-specific restriction endonuclease McrA